MWNRIIRIRYSLPKNVCEAGLPGVDTHGSKIVAGIAIHGPKFSDNLLLFMELK